MPRRVIELFHSPQGQRETNEQTGPKEKKGKETGTRTRIKEMYWDRERGGGRTRQNVTHSIASHGTWFLGLKVWPKLWNEHLSSSHQRRRIKVEMCLHPKYAHLSHFGFGELEMLLQAQSLKCISDSFLLSLVNLVHGQREHMYNHPVTCSSLCSCFLNISLKQVSVFTYRGVRIPHAILSCLRWKVKGQGHRGLMCACYCECDILGMPWNNCLAVKGHWPLLAHMCTCTRIRIWVCIKD